MRRLLLRDHKPRQRDPVPEKLAGPCAGGDHHTARGDLAGVNDHDGAVALNADVADRRRVFKAGAVRLGGVAKRQQRVSGTDPSGAGHHQDVTPEVHPPPALCRLCCGKEVALNAALGV
ncbi:hypothetical protein D9M72_456990 [compost metagenome]